MPQIPVECSYCGADFELPRWRVERTDRNFCDNDCRGAWLSENQSGSDHHQYDSVTRECSACGSSVTQPRWQAEQYDHAFCDKKCHGEWLSEHGQGEGNSRWKRESIECSNCGGELERPPSLIGQRNFCDSSCYGEWRSETFTGEDHPRWAGGRVPYGPGWTEERREAVRERDGRQCRLCGVPESDILETTGRKLDVHHIIPAREIEDPERRNAAENLMALCPGCHGEIEALPVTPQVET